MSYHPDVQQVLNTRRRNKRNLTQKLKAERKVTPAMRSGAAAAMRRMAGDL